MAGGVRRSEAWQREPGALPGNLSNPGQFLLPVFPINHKLSLEEKQEIARLVVVPDQGGELKK